MLDLFPRFFDFLWKYWKVPHHLLVKWEWFLQIVDIGNFNMKLNGMWFPQIVDTLYRDSRNLCPIYIYIYIYKTNCGVSFWTCWREISGDRVALSKLCFYSESNGSVRLIYHLCPTWCHMTFPVVNLETFDCCINITWRCNKSVTSICWLLHLLPVSWSLHLLPTVFFSNISEKVPFWAIQKKCYVYIQTVVSGGL